MLTGICGEYSVCDGQPDRICTGQKFGAPIGFGGAGKERLLKQITILFRIINLKCVLSKKHHEPEMSVPIFGKKIALPLWVQVFLELKVV